jgi:hypothetical protein
MSISPETLVGFRHQVENEWRDNIAPFWLRYAPACDMPKLSQWKCPYHNGRMSFEISRRLSDILQVPLND